MRIDAHQHFWAYNPADYGWIGPGMEILKRDFLPPDLAPLLQQAGLDGSVAVQARQSLTETEWLLALADAYPFIQGVVGWVDLNAPDAAGQLEHFANYPKLCGLRHVLQDEPDDRFMLRETFLRGLRAVVELDLTYDILIFPRHLPVACELVEQFPEGRFVLDHIAKPLIKDSQLAPWDRDIRRLAAFPNVTCKVSGMVTEANWQSWQPADFRPYLDLIFEAFGPGRIMFGSDWPVCTLAGSYARVVNLVADYAARLSDSEQADVWGETARRFYGLG